MGRNGLNALLKLSSLSHLVAPEKIDEMPTPQFSFNAISNLVKTLERVYGPKGGRGLALRIGRACFNNGMRQYGAETGVTELAFRLLPFHARVEGGAKALAELFNKYTDQQVRVEIDGSQFLWIIDRCPVCWDRHESEPACHLAVGILQEALYWLSGGKLFNVEEKTCIAAGDDTCTISIDFLSNN